jgi:hypothetical protein
MFEYASSESKRRNAKTISPSLGNGFRACPPLALGLLSPRTHSAKCQIGIGIFVTKEKKQWKIQSNEKMHSDFRKIRNKYLKLLVFYVRLPTFRSFAKFFELRLSLWQ